MPFLEDILGKIRGEKGKVVGSNVRPAAAPTPRANSSAEDKNTNGTRTNGTKPSGAKPPGASKPQQTAPQRPNTPKNDAPATAFGAPNNRPTPPIRRPVETTQVAGEDAPQKPFGMSAQSLVPSRETALTEVRERTNQVATDEQIEKFIALATDKVDVMTANGGELNANANQRQVCAFFADGTFLVQKDNPLSPESSEIRNSIRRRGYKVTETYLVELDVIRRVHEAAERRNGGRRRNATEMQDMQKQFIRLIKEAADRRCSDVHVVVERYEARIRVRADGVMEFVRQMKSDFATDLCSAAFNMADASDATYRPLEYQGARVSDIRSPLPDGVQSVRLQFNPLPNGGRYMICRLLYANSAADSGGDVDTLGYARTHIDQIKKMRKKPYGINVISGPTGSGKSTTLQRALTSLMREKRNQINVITIEDPPEYVIAGAQQLPVTNASTDEERNEKFRQAISASLRSDPDVVMIGEIRDKASSSLAFAAAMTGHQVWASLHANDAISILDRFRDQHVEVYKLGDHTLVTGLIGQRLIRKLCKNCKIPFHKALAEGVLSAEMGESVLTCVGEERAKTVCVANPEPCNLSEFKCRNGYAGREVIAECIVPDLKFMEFIKSDNKQGAVDYWLDNLDGLAMLEHALQKMVRGLCDPHDVEERAGDLRDFRKDRADAVFGHLFDEIKEEKK